MRGTDDVARTEPEDLEVFSANMARVYDVSQDIWKLYVSTREQDEGEFDADPFNAIPAFAQLASSLAMKPEAVMQASVAYWTQQMAAWQAATAKVMGTGVPEDAGATLPVGGRRFSHAQWSENALFEYIKRSYLLASDWTENVVRQSDDGMDLADHKKVAFMTRNFVEAMNPANFFALNPEVIEATFEQNGENLVRGAEMMLADMERGQGELLIRQTDMDAFAVGENMAVTAGKVVYRNDLFELIQYAPTTETVHETPLLIIPPWINKYYVLDLNEKKSLVKWLVGQGHTVFITSWVNPTEKQKHETWETYQELSLIHI